MQRVVVAEPTYVSWEDLDETLPSSAADGCAGSWGDDPFNIVARLEEDLGMPLFLAQLE